MTQPTVRMCEYDNCSRRATTSYKFASYDIYDGVSTESTERCANHPVADPRFTATPIIQRPGQLHPVFMEALAPFAPELFAATCPNCGKGEDSTGNLPLACQKGRC